MKKKDLRVYQTSDYSVHYRKKKDNQKYRSDPKFSDRYGWANSEEPNQTAQGHTVCHFICIVWTDITLW